MSIITPDMYDEFDPRNIVFESVKQCTTPNGSKFSRIYIKYKYDDETVDTLVLQTPILFTWGISMGKSFNDNDVGTPQLSLVSFNTAIGPTKEEEKYLQICGQILDTIKSHLMNEDVKEELDKWDMDAAVSSMKLFYVKMEKGRPIKGFPPTLYSKLYFQKTKDGAPVITSRISDAKTGEDLPQLPLLGPSTVYTTLVFSNIYIGTKPSVQTRIGEIMVVERKERRRHLQPMTVADEVHSDGARPGGFHHSEGDHSGGARSGGFHHSGGARSGGFHHSGGARTGGSHSGGFHSGGHHVQPEATEVPIIKIKALKKQIR